MVNYSDYYAAYDPIAAPAHEMEDRVFKPIKHLLNHGFERDGLEPIPQNSDRWASRIIIDYTLKPVHVYYAKDVTNGA